MLFSIIYDFADIGINAHTSHICHICHRLPFRIQTTARKPDYILADGAPGCNNIDGIPDGLFYAQRLYPIVSRPHGNHAQCEIRKRSLLPMFLRIGHDAVQDIVSGAVPSDSEKFTIAEGAGFKSQACRRTQIAGENILTINASVFQKAFCLSPTFTSLL